MQSCFGKNENGCIFNAVSAGLISAKVVKADEANDLESLKERKFEEVVKSAEQAAVLVLVY